MTESPNHHNPLLAWLNVLLSAASLGVSLYIISIFNERGVLLAHIAQVLERIDHEQR